MAVQATARSRPTTTWRRRLRALASDKLSPYAFIIGDPTAAEAEWSMKKWADWAAKQLQPGMVEKAQTFAREQMTSSEKIIRASTLDALAMGSLAPMEAEWPLPLQLEALFWRHLLLELGQAFAMVKEYVASARVLGALAYRFAVDPSGCRAAVVAAAASEVVNHPAARHFEREVFQHWALTVELLGHTPRVVHERAVRRGLWKSYHQRPLDHCARCAPTPASWHCSPLACLRVPMLQTHQHCVAGLFGTRPSCQRHALLKRLTHRSSPSARP